MGGENKERKSTKYLVVRIVFIHMNRRRVEKIKGFESYNTSHCFLIVFFPE